MYILTSFRFISKDEKSFVIGTFSKDGETASGIIGDTASLASMGINFTVLRAAKSEKIGFHVEKIGTWTDSNGNERDKFSVEFATE